MKPVLVSGTDNACDSYNIISVPSPKNVIGKRHLLIRDDGAPPRFRQATPIICFGGEGPDNVYTLKNHPLPVVSKMLLNDDVLHIVATPGDNVESLILTAIDTLAEKHIVVLTFDDPGLSMRAINAFHETMSGLFKFNGYTSVANRNFTDRMVSAIRSGLYDLDSFTESMSLGISLVRGSIAIPIYTEKSNTVCSNVFAFMRNATAEYGRLEYASYTSNIHTDNGDGVLSVDGKKLYSTGSFTHSVDNVKTNLMHDLDALIKHTINGTKNMKNEKQLLGKMIARNWEGM